MKSRQLVLKWFSLAVLLAMIATVSAAQPAEQTATEFYMSYKAAFRKAKKMDELLPYMSKAKLGEIQELPVADRPAAFEMMKDMYVFSNQKVVKETRTPTGATLEVEAVDPNKKKYKATVELVRENNAWKFQDESWSSAS